MNKKLWYQKLGLDTSRRVIENPISPTFLMTYNTYTDNYEVNLKPYQVAPSPYDFKKAKRIAREWQKSHVILWGEEKP